ncbi:MAG TPA: PqqD family protein [Nocardioides sp.]|nr:PqqD family protein [Nocardioides sp.]
MKLRVDDITWREIDGELVILDLRSSTYLTANGSGSVLMRELTEERSLPELAQALVDAYGIPAARAKRDVAAFVDTLGDHRLLERSGARHGDPVAGPGDR